MTAKQFYNFHRSQFDTWEHGEIKKTWIDENGNICIMYQSGKWWHYNVDKKGKIIFCVCLSPCYSLIQPFYFLTLFFSIYVYNNRCIVAICSLTAVVLRIYILFLR